MPELGLIMNKIISLKKLTFPQDNYQNKDIT